jgi:hypothetical protein
MLSPFIALLSLATAFDLAMALPSNASILVQPDRAIFIQHVTIPCNRTFEAAKAALEAAVPALNTTYQSYLASGDAQGALAALQALPTLNSFVTPPRNFGALLALLNHTAKAVQYEIGNPLTATRMTQYELGVAVYTPIRVLLRESPEGVAGFEFDSPASALAQFQNANVDMIAKELDRNLTQVLVEAAGWERFGQWELSAS